VLAGESGVGIGRGGASGRQAALRARAIGEERVRRRRAVSSESIRGSRCCSLEVECVRAHLHPLHECRRDRCRGVSKVRRDARPREATEARRPRCVRAAGGARISSVASRRCVPS
jgi:hypothetical protein